MPSNLTIDTHPTRPGTPTPEADPVAEHTVVWRYLRALGASSNEADDLAQEAMLVAVRTDDERIANRQAFLLGVARHQWLRSRRWWQRRREREIADAVDELWHETADTDGGAQLIEQLRDCLEQLQPRTRQALDMHYGDGLSWPEVAARIDMLPNGIKTLAQRARQTLRTCIERKSS